MGFSIGGGSSIGWLELDSGAGEGGAGDASGAGAGASGSSGAGGSGGSGGAGEAAGGSGARDSVWDSIGDSTGVGLASGVGLGLGVGLASGSGASVGSGEASGSGICSAGCSCAGIGAVSIVSVCDAGGVRNTIARAATIVPKRAANPTIAQIMPLERDRREAFALGTGVAATVAGRFGATATVAAAVGEGG